MTIRLKCWRENWDAIAAGEKTTEIRNTDDRTFAVGDILELERFDPDAQAATMDGGRKQLIAVRITHIDTMAGDVHFFGVRMNQPQRRGCLVRLAVLSIYVMGPVYE